MRSLSAPAAHIDAMEVLADVLSRGDDDLAGEAFYGRLCEAVCQLTAMRRAVIFRYDPAYRRVRAVGAHGIGLEHFTDAHLGLEDAPIARRALAEDRVTELEGDFDREVPARYAHLLRDSLLVVTPMVAAGRWIGVVLSVRPADEPLQDADRHLLWTLGKATAVAATARGATYQSAKAQQLEQRIDLAREIHGNVVQRLFGVSMALSGAGGLSPGEIDRCALEVQEALAELRTAIQRPLGRASRATRSTLAEELARLGHMHPGLGISLVAGDPTDVPADIEPLAQSVLAEAIRNAGKHAQPTRVEVQVLRADGAFKLAVVNDGLREGSRNGWGMGLRLATLEAVQRGGLVEFGEREPGKWEVRLVVPDQR